MEHAYTEADIIRFVRGEMAEDEHNRLELAMQSNESLSAEVENIRHTLSILDQQGAFVLKERFKKLERKKAYKKWIYVILVLMSLFLSGYWVKKVLVKEKMMDSKAIYAQYFEPYRSPVVTRSQEGTQSIMQSATKAYQQKDYNLAFDLFLGACSEVNQESCFYASLSAIYAYDNRYPEAKNNIGKHSPYLSIILWNEALLFLKNSDNKKAKATLKELVKRGDYKKDESLKILKNLELTE
ncbi:MAG: hypothetical protein AAGA77_04305 [Bacteroidota bacterium]